MARYYDAGDNAWYERDYSEWAEYDGPSARELAEDADADIEHYADVESFQAHYGDEINGNAEPPVDDVPTVRYGELRNAAGQLRLPLGAAY